MEWSSVVNLKKSFFSEKEQTLAVFGNLNASTFLYSSGVHALRITNDHGNIVMLPYQGQQIWSCSFLGRDLTMKSIFSQPVATREFLETYGGFLLHCGAAASMGVPSERDNHPLHGELPNAPYQDAYIKIGQDEIGRFMGLGGRYHHMVACSHNYLAEPSIKVYEDSTIIHSSMEITNLKKTDMELMYLMHVNFRPVDGSRLVYSAHCQPEDVKVHMDIPSEMGLTPAAERLADFIKQLTENPGLHDVLETDQIYDPEIVFTIKYKADEKGNSYSLQIHPDGYASYLSHRPSEFKYGLRWISRTRAEDALGLALPSTAEHKGYLAEKEKGNIEIIPPGGKAVFNVKAGLLKPPEVEDISKRISKILSL